MPKRDLLTPKNTRPRCPTSSRRSFPDFRSLFLSDRTLNPTRILRRRLVLIHPLRSFFFFFCRCDKSARMKGRSRRPVGSRPPSFCRLQTVGRGRRRNTTATSAPSALIPSCCHLFLREGEREGKLGSDKLIDVTKELYTLRRYVFMMSWAARHPLLWHRRNSACLLLEMRICMVITRSKLSRKNSVYIRGSPI